MTSPTISKLTLYYDSDHDDPEESIAELRDHLRELAARDGITVEEQDTAAFSEAEREELFQELTALVQGRPYSVGNRVFTKTMFAASRPVLRIDYAADDQPSDIYPHRNDEVSNLPISATTVLEHLLGEGSPEESDFTAIHSGSSQESVADTGDGQAESESTPDDEPSMIDQLRSIIT